MSNSSFDINKTVFTIIDYFHKRKLPQVLTVSSTCDNAHVISPQKVPSGGESSIVIFTQNDSQISTELRSLYDQGYYFDQEDIKCTRSLHQSNLFEAKELLIKKVLINNPSVCDIIKMILNIGIALNIQIDKNHPIYNNNTIKDNINKKLEFLGLKSKNERLYNKYQNLNKYYNATKHAKKPENKMRQEVLSSLSFTKINILKFL